MNKFYSQQFIRNLKTPGLMLVLLMMAFLSKAQITVFTEDWTSSSFSTNNWTFAPSQGNWNITGNYTPPGSSSPSATFEWGTPSQITNYSHSLVSPVINASSYVNLTLDFNLYLSNYSTATLEQMTIEYKKVSSSTWTLLTNYTNASGTFNLSLTNQALTGMDTSSFQIRFTASGFDSYNINGWGIDDIVIKGTPSTACAGVPTAGTAYAPSGVCANTPFMLSDTAFTIAAGINLQWQSSPGGQNNWTNITGATNASYLESAGITSAMDYRMIITCANSSSSDTSNVVSVAIAPAYNCYCQPPATLLHSFVNDFISNVTITGTTLNSSNATNSTTGYTSVPSTPASNTASMTQGAFYNLVCTINSSQGAPLQAAAWLDINHRTEFLMPQNIRRLLLDPQRLPVL